ncbi:ribosylnicotinamide kinase [Apiotrichum porosum]|uniref:Ribosylnicotinamide kinase n=1 Tax=Apiotrichum porosum TaxID=105984 RepID=A0A427Y548_9TREE|nr:ribosylnicotinamide kinase [Apiotrichum porosum]RSH86213.1 ribosylnicotinamide kinase [Apiotrichum porosum]
MPTRVILVGIGGASCSGKTLLAKHLARLLGPGHSVLIHQDDFAPTSEMVPVSPEFGVQDWDDPPTCVEWPRMRQVLGAIRQSGKVPQEHDSFDHLNAQVEVGVDGGVVHEWGTKLGQVTVTGGGEEKIVWVLVDGFVLYWDRGVSDALDVKLLMRVPRAVLKARREARATYVLQNAEDAATGGVWTDPPGYFDNIVYPAYVKAHASVMSGGDVENGTVTTADITVLAPGEGEGEMTRVLGEACAVLVAAANAGVGSYVE